MRKPTKEKEEKRTMARIGIQQMLIPCHDAPTLPPCTRTHQVKPSDFSCSHPFVFPALLVCIRVPISLISFSLASRLLCYDSVIVQTSVSHLYLAVPGFLYPSHGSCGLLSRVVVAFPCAACHLTLSLHWQDFLSCVEVPRTVKSRVQS